MSLLAATQIPKPADEQALERASVVLWRRLLNDPSVQRNGRRGQRQSGVDLFGIRDGDADWHVGIQCKLNSQGHALSEDEVRGEVTKALTFKPSLKEYYIITTAPDDVAMQENMEQPGAQQSGRPECEEPSSPPCVASVLVMQSGLPKASSIREPAVAPPTAKPPTKSWMYSMSATKIAVDLNRC